MVHGWLGDTAATVDVEAVSVVLLGAVVNYRRSTWTFATRALLGEARDHPGWFGPFQDRPVCQ